ncbi:MAG TPA: hypothetical protein DIC42_02940 [Holosporales bacterium]|nr:hypothetical protein [Holosporales bacterium]
MYKWKNSTMMRQYPVLFGMLLSISAHTVIAMTIYTLNSTTPGNNHKKVDFPLVDFKWQEPQEKPIVVKDGNQNKTKHQLPKKKSSAMKSASLTNDIPHDLKPSVYNEMPTYPAAAQQQNIEGNFSVSLILDKSGHVTQIIFQTNNEPPTLLKAEVIKKLSKWKFTSSQNLTNMQINVPIQFKLDV